MQKKTSNHPIPCQPNPADDSREWRAPMDFARWIGVTKKHYSRTIRPILEAANVPKLPISKTRYRWHVPSALRALQEALG